MGLWQNLKDWGRNLMQRTAAATGIAREYKDIFELGGVPAFARFYREGIFVWKALYRGFYKAWHVIPAPTIESPGATRQMYRLNAPKAVCAELAGLVWGEQAEVHVSRNGAQGEDDPLDLFVNEVLKDNAFSDKLQQMIEQGLALGHPAGVCGRGPVCPAELGQREYLRGRVRVADGEGQILVHPSGVAP